MPRNAVDVRTRVLVAARAEFAERGLAGARIDRIAAEAQASKERLYAYFGDKVSLFRAVLGLNATEFHEAIPLDPADVIGFVAAVFDHSIAHPEHLRMLTWARMEGIGYRLPGDSGATPQRVEALRQAQQLGHIDGSWHPEELLELLFGLAHAWVHAPTPPADQATDTASHRRAIVEAAQRLLSSPAHPQGDPGGYPRGEP